MNKKIWQRVCAITCLAAAFGTAACTAAEDGGKKPEGIEYTAYTKNTVAYNDNSDESLTSFNTDLYYLNTWENYKQTGTEIGFPDMGDPTVVYYEGNYYAYGTRGTDRYHCFRSPDLQHWTRIEDCFVPEPGTWGASDYWAPDVQKIGDRWYLYYTARSRETKRVQIGVAVADAPYGPFKQFTGTNGDGVEVGIGDNTLQGMEKDSILDATVFQDDIDADGDGQPDLYMFFSYEPHNSAVDSENKSRTKDPYAAEIWGVKMKDAVTWDLSTLTPLVSPGYRKLSDGYRTIAWETWSPSFDKILGVECTEGPYMVKHNGKYYLTYCANSFVDINYAVGYAVCESPLGEYVKPNDTYLQNMLLGVPAEAGTYTANRYLGFSTGTGHAAVFRTGDGQLMFAYHAHYNRDEWDYSTEKGQYRVLAIDYLCFDGDGNPYTNGPTYSLQALPGDISGYRNIASQATFRAEGENVEYLYDNFTNRAYGTKEVARETTFKAGTRSIEIKFDRQVTVKAVNVYNSYDRSLSIDTIRQIDFGSGRGLIDAAFNQRYYSAKYDDFIYPHCAFNIELDDELTTDRLVITITSDHDFALGEIEILGK